MDLWDMKQGRFGLVLSQVPKARPGTLGFVDDARFELDVRG